MAETELTVQYGVELTGDLDDHEKLKDAIEDAGGEIVVEKDKAGYFEAIDDDSTDD